MFLIFILSITFSISRNSSSYYVCCFKNNLLLFIYILNSLFLKYIYWTWTFYVMFVMILKPVDLILLAVFTLALINDILFPYVFYVFFFFYDKLIYFWTLSMKILWKHSKEFVFTLVRHAAVLTDGNALFNLFLYFALK